MPDSKRKKPTDWRDVLDAVVGAVLCLAVAAGVAYATYHLLWW